MSTKFTECTLGQMYREVRHDGHVLGGPVQYLSTGICRARHGGSPAGSLAVLFALLCIGGSMGGGNSLPGEPVDECDSGDGSLVRGLRPGPTAWLMTLLVAIVIVGGIRRIAHVADKIVPLMAMVYVTAALAVILMNVSVRCQKRS